MTRTEMNELPTVKPLLLAWRAARAERDRIMSDNRFSFKRQPAAERAAREAETKYDAAIRAVIEEQSR